MAEVKIGKNESLDSALRRFKRQCQRSGILAGDQKTESIMRSRVYAGRRKPKPPKKKTEVVVRQLHKGPPNWVRGTFILLPA